VPPMEKKKMAKAPLPQGLSSQSQKIA